ncbi:MAG: T9SS type A sorting domain-containing protein [Bacteroidales bacterium]|nr:T9SS type A sorting domain-containing protein [Bacteroidales bacterium]
MKHLIIAFTLFTLFFATNLCSQNTTFEYLLSSPLDEYFTDIVEIEDGMIYFTARLSDVKNPNRIRALVAKIDHSGNLIDSLVFTLPDKNIYINSLFRTENGEFDIVASIYDTADLHKNAGVALFGMNEQLSLFDETRYYLPPTFKLASIYPSITANGDILIGITMFMPNVPKSYLYILDNNFDSINAVFFPDKAREINQLKNLNNGKIWMLDQLGENYELLDSSLNIISTQRVPEVLSANYGMKWDTDTSFYLLGDQIVPRPAHSLGFIRQFHPIDTTGYLSNHWRVSDTVDFPALWNGIDFQNKDSIFIGGTRNMWVGFYNSWPSWFVVLQTDSMLNIRWERFYGGDAYYMMGKVVATNDGGCLVAGTRYDYRNTTQRETDIIILKLNSEGLILGTRENPGIKMQEAIVYPNPGNEEIKVRIAVQYKQSLFELFDLNGRLVLQEDFSGTEGTVNTTFLPSGTYIYKISSKDGLFESGKWVRQ